MDPAMLRSKTAVRPSALPPGGRHDAERDCRLVMSGGTVAYTRAGAGPVLLLIHGLGGTRRTWRSLIGRLAATHTVIAPDLPGHGDSDPPAGDYALGAHAAVLRDLMIGLGIHRATVAGHSLGGGVAMQFAYQFPERTERLILISSGGFGAELTPLLRAVTLPGAESFVAGMSRIPEVVSRPLLTALSRRPRLVARQDTRLLASSMRQLASSRQRRAFIRTAHSVINWQGQAVSASRQLRLLAGLPVLIAWGSDDRTIPPQHHKSLARYLPDAHEVEISDSGHFPHETAPDQLIPHMLRFLLNTDPYRFDEARWRALLTLDQAVPDLRGTSHSRSTPHEHA